MSRLKVWIIYMKKRTENASLTVEASLVFPLFLFAVLSLCTIFRYLNAQYVVEKCMLSVARTAGAYPEIIKAISEQKEAVTESFLGEIALGRLPLCDRSVGEITGELADSLIIEELLQREIRKYPYAEGVISGSVNCLGSVLYSTEETIRIKCAYSLKTPFHFLYSGADGIKVDQELEYRYFTGHMVESMLKETEAGGAEDTDDTIVYVTEYGTVYHRSLECPSLRLVISQCPFPEVESRRNMGGGKYYPCERCAGRGHAPEIVYITKDGDRYHYDRMCSGLKRTITEMILSEAARTKRPCRRCRPQEYPDATD